MFVGNYQGILHLRHSRNYPAPRKKPPKITYPNHLKVRKVAKPVLHLNGVKPLKLLIATHTELTSIPANSEVLLLGDYKKSNLSTVYTLPRQETIESNFNLAIHWYLENSNKEYFCWSPEGSQAYPSTVPSSQLVVTGQYLLASRKVVKTILFCEEHKNVDGILLWTRRANRSLGITNQPLSPNDPAKMFDDIFEILPADKQRLALNHKTKWSNVLAGQIHQTNQKTPLVSSTERPKPVTIKPSYAVQSGTIDVVIGHRGLERLDNLLRVIESFRRQTVPPRITVVEQDMNEICRSQIEPLVDQYIFCYSDLPYNRSWAFNVGVKQANSDYVLLHDNDLLVPENYLEHCLNKKYTADVFQPWRRINYLDKHATKRYPLNPVYRHHYSNRNIHGGSNFVKREWFLTIGGMDERMYGWGSEDDWFYERTRRIGRYLKADKRGSTLIHLWHPIQSDKQNHWKRNRAILVSSVKNAKQIMVPDFGNPNKLIENTHQPFDQTKQKFLHIIYDVEGWAYWNRARALIENAPNDWIVTASNKPSQKTVNVTLILAYGHLDTMYDRIRSNSDLLVGGINVGWPRRLNEFEKLKKKCDAILVNNQDFWIKSGQLPITHWISNGVSLKTFHPVVDFSKRRDRVLWIGSTYHAELKGYGKQDSILRVLEKKLPELGLETDFKVIDSHNPKKRMNQSQMNAWYNTGKYYLVASRNEGTPNPLLESAACGLIPISTRVGNAPELIIDQHNGRLVNRDVDRFIEAIQWCRDKENDLNKAILDSIKSWDWPERSKQYYALFDRLLEENFGNRTN